MTNTYAKNYNIATQKAAKDNKVSVEDVRTYYRKVKDAPKGVKRACIEAHKIMANYAKAPAVEPVEA
jgi:hypothetical protein